MRNDKTVRHSRGAHETEADQRDRGVDAIGTRQAVLGFQQGWTFLEVRHLKCSLRRVGGREQGKFEGSCVTFLQELTADDWTEDWIRLHCIEEDLGMFEEAGRETRDKTVAQTRKERRTFEESLILMRTTQRQYSRRAPERRSNQRWQMMHELQTKKSVFVCRELTSASEETRSDVQEEITVDEAVGVDPWCCCSRLGVTLSLAWLQWARTHIQVLRALLGEVQGGGRGVHQSLV